MTTKSSSGLAHHTFAPWRVDGDRRVVAGENEWVKPLKWNETAEFAAELWEAIGGNRGQPGAIKRDDGSTAAYSGRPRVLVGVDVFEDWQRAMSLDGSNLFRKRANGDWLTDGTSGILRNDFPVTMHDVRDRLFRLIDSTPNLDWLMFTQTPENIAGMLPGVGMLTSDLMVWPDMPNLWLGTDIGDQATADERIPHLLKVPVKVRMVRYSGVGKVSLTDQYWWDNRYQHAFWRAAFPNARPPIDLLIISGEVGPDARPCNLEHVRDAIRQAKAAGVKVWVERLGSDCRVVGMDDWPAWVRGREMSPFPLVDDIKAKMKHPHGADPAEWPEDLRIWEVPTC